MVDSSEVIKQLDHILEFQLNDLRKGSILATANFLVAVGCMNSIEFLGGVRNGELKLSDKEKKEGKKYYANQDTRCG